MEKNIYILGLSCFYHDSSACLIKNGKVIAAAAEERFTRKKHDISFPYNAAMWCLKYADISLDDVNYVAFYEKPILKFERVLNQHLEMFPKSFWTFFKSMPSWLNQKLRITKIIKKKLKYKGDIFFIKHHMCHAAAAYLLSNFNEAAILTIDGVGESITTALGYADGSDIRLRKKIEFPHSLGLLYSAVTAHLGFKVNNSEYKVMGLSCYGNQDRSTNQFYKIFKNDVVSIKEDGSYRLNMDYFTYHYKDSMVSRKFIDKFGKVRKRKEHIKQKHVDIAAALQMITEDIILALLKHLYDETGCKNLCLGGGVALNSVANGKILKNTQFENIYIQPAAGDCGTSMGAAFYAYNTILKNKRTFVLEKSYLGPEYSTDDIKMFLDQNKIRYSILGSDKQLMKKTAMLLSKGNIIAWFQGRMEWGPRALGHRSILADPRDQKLKEKLNLLKGREAFRPFAPIICKDTASAYFDMDNPIQKPTDFMLMVYPIKTEKIKLIPGVAHIDGSGRLQTLSQEHNPRLYGLIKEFGKITSLPLLINTSFNVAGEPIVCTPEDAYKSFLNLKIDYLILDNFLISKKPADY